MEITLANFEQVVDPAILQRGRDYYDRGHILELDEVQTGYWRALIEGTATYQVLIVAMPDSDLAWTCDCPYDGGPVCKHVAATLYALESASASIPAKKTKRRAKRKTREDKIRDALGSLSKEQLYDLALEMALNDRELGHRVLARYGPDQGNEKAYAQLVRDALSLGQDRHGFLDYWGAARAAKAVNEILNRAGSHLAEGRPSEAIPIYQAVLEGVVPAMAHADDSMGALGDCVAFALDGLQHAAEDLTPPEREEIFTYCVKRAPQEPYTDWDWSWDLAAIAAELVATSQQRATLFALLDRMAARREDKGWGADYDRERAAIIKLSTIKRQEDDAAVEAFLEAHLEIERMCMALARFHLERGDPAAARRLCMEWLERPPQHRRGLSQEFLTILLDAAEFEGDREEQIRLNEALLQQTGRFAHYQRLKELIGQDAWLEYRSDLLQRIKQERWGRVDLGAVYIAERMWEALLALVQADPQSAPHYHDYLSSRFPLQLSAVYEQLALATLERKVNRGGYQEACGYLKRMQQLGQEERVSELVAQLRQQYKQRRALLDELGKAFGP